MTAYRDAVLEIVIRERDDALNRLHTLRQVCDRYQRNGGTYVGIGELRIILGPNHDHTEHTP